MFNFGISEIMIIAVVGLIVIGPERLPKVARTMGHMFGRMQRYASQIKSDINKEMQLEELKSIQKSMKDAADEIEQNVTQQVNYIESEVDDINKDVNQSLSDGNTSTSEQDSVTSDIPPGLRSAIIESDAAHDGVNSDEVEADRSSLDEDRVSDDDLKTDDEKVVETQSAQAGINLMAGLGIQSGKLDEHVGSEVTGPQQEVSSKADAKSSKSA
jgi:sec-independent protein translocase protein TatB